MARYDPGLTGTPTDLVVTATGDGQVSLAWSEAFNASAYNIYYSTSPNVTRFNGTKFGSSTGTSAIVTGLQNYTLYYFVVTATNSSGESGVSNEVSATPAIPGTFIQTEMAGVWRFNILVSGATSGWMRGTLSLDNYGTATIASFLDSAGGTTAPDYLFPALLVDPSGNIRDTASVDDALFQGVVGGKQRDFMAGSLITAGGSHLFAVLQKHNSLVTFSNDGDLKGFGSTAGGSRRFSYCQISSGSLEEWEFALGQIGQDRTIQYSTFTAPSGPATPGKKATIISITEDGIVSEAPSAAVTQPTVYIPAGVMSDDKSLIVTTATDSVNPGKYVLRIYGMINIVPSDANTFTLADVAGTYAVESLVVGTSTLTAHASVTGDGTTGAFSFNSYADSTGNTALPPDFTVAIDTDGILSSVADATFHGKLAYNKDIMIGTKSEGGGYYSFSLGFKSYLEEE